MVGMEYWCSLPAISMTAVDDLWWIGAPTDAVVFVEEIVITNSDTTTNDQLEILFFRTTTDQSAVGGAITPRPLETHFPAAGSVVRDTRGGADAAITTSIWVEGQNILNGWHFKGSYEEPLLILSPTAGTAGRCNLRLDKAPAAATLIAGRIKIREIGG